MLPITQPVPDPTLEQWQQIANVLQERNLLPFIDFAYQGFADGIEQDAAPVRLFCKPDNELIICNSFSKTFGLYRERVGALTVVTKNKETASTVASQIKRTIRANYSNPPAHVVRSSRWSLGINPFVQNGNKKWMPCALAFIPPESYW